MTRHDDPETDWDDRPETETTEIIHDDELSDVIAAAINRFFDNDRMWYSTMSQSARNVLHQEIFIQVQALIRQKRGGR